MAALIAGVAVTSIWLLSGSLREPVTRASPRIASLGVLPLENLSGDPEQAYFVDGMQEALTAELSRIRALRSPADVHAAPSAPGEISAGNRPCAQRGWVD